MRAAGIIMRWLAWPVIVMLVMPPGILAQDSGQPGQANKFKKEELAQMLAPIALYPDSLIADILMASTYPLEVVDAERWRRENKGLTGDALDDALQEKSWEASIKVLCHFPEVLFAMSDKLDQTRKLGDAFLSQQDDVMAVIQELRRKAVEQGNLKTTKEQNVIIDKDSTKIEPADPRIVYVPVYDPLYAYGPWWYPAYPPYYWYYPPGVVISGGFIGFGTGWFVGIDLFSWYWFDWHRHVIHIDHDRARRFDRFDHERRRFDRPFWQHDPSHRRGVAYRDRSTSERFGGVPFRVQPPIHEKRGYPERRFEGPTVAPFPHRDRRIAPEKRSGAPTVAPSPPAPSPPTQEMRTRPEKRSQGTAVAPPPAPLKQLEVVPAPRARMMPPGVQGKRDRNTPFSGIGNGSFEQRASERGGRSRQSGEEFRRGGGPEQRGGGSGKDGGPRGIHKK